MPDDSNDLRATLARLHEQLRAARDVTPETRAQLERVIDEIHALLAADESDEPPEGDVTVTEISGIGPESIVSRLSAAEQEFEATHPTLSGVIERLIDGLGKMGI